ncbi:condensation domain-containing protein [Amycolatopsis sp. cmx-4-83]|uniref:condensation domain-containing protein n=1 Tax=Amycolatopsis sp. cmx-4-83 TaxID=2790940 RepID=UPI0039784C1B
MTAAAKHSIEALLPCTAAQAAIAEASQDAYREQTVVRVTGPLEPGRMRLAWAQVQHDHQVTRLTLHRHDGRWVQVVRTEGHPASWAVHDLRRIPAAQRRLIVTELTHTAAQALDVRAGPLLRLDLLIESDNTALLVLTHHHAAADGSTIGLLLQALATGYAGQPDPPRVDLVSATRRLWARTSGSPLADFADDIADMPALLPTWPEPVGLTELVTEHRTVPIDITQIKSVAATYDATLAMVVQAALLAVLAHGRSEPSACLSLAVDLRALVPEALHTGGLFLTTLPITARIGPTDTGLTIAAQLGQRGGHRRLHPDISLPQVLMAASAAGHQGMPDTLLTIQGSTRLPPAPPGLSWHRVRSTERTEFALNVDVEWSDDIVLRVQFDRARAPVHQVSELLDRVVAVLTQPSRPVATLLREPGWLRMVRSQSEVGSPELSDLLPRVLTTIRRVTQEEVGPDDDLLRAGHSSLTLMSIVVGLAEQGVPCTVGALLDQPTARAAAAYSAQRLKKNQVLTTADGIAASAFTPIEAGLLARTDRIEWGPQPMHEQSVLTFAEVLEPIAARQAWRWVVERYPALGRNWSETVQLTVPELATAKAADAHAAARSWLTAQLGTPFRPDAPLLRAALFVDARSSSLALAFHNALLDGWSFPTLIRELQRSYAAVAAGTEPPPPLGDDGHVYRRWLAGRQDGDHEFWGQALAGSVFPPRCETPPPGERAVARCRRALPDLAAVASEVGSTPNMVAAALTAAAFAHVTGQPPDEPLGVRASARPTELPGAMRMVGQFTAELPMPQLTSTPQPWSEAIRHLAASIEVARRHSHLGETGIRSAAACPPEADLYRNLLVVEEYLPIDEWAAQAGPDAWTHRNQWRREVSPSVRTLYVEPTVGGYDLVLSTSARENSADLLAAVAAQASAMLDSPARTMPTVFGLAPALTTS